MCVIHGSIRSSVCPHARRPSGDRQEDFELKRMTEAGMPASSAELMSPEQRFDEVASILARDCRRAIRDLPNGQQADSEAGNRCDIPLSDLSTPNQHE